jgi:hypothetical protein
MADSLEEGILAVLGEDVAITTIGANQEEQTLSESLSEIITHYDKAKGYLKNGDLENYAREMKIVDNLLENLEQSLDDEGT